MMVGKCWYADGRDPREFPESWADEYDQHFGWLYEGSHYRRSDPGGFGTITREGDRLNLSAYTGPGECANGFRPGPEKHNSGEGHSQDPAQWLDGPRTISLDGDVVWWVRYSGRSATAEIVDSGQEPAPQFAPGTKFAYRAIRRVQEMVADGRTPADAESDEEFQRAFAGWLRKWRGE